MESRIVIIGASLAGLTAARALRESECEDFLVVDAKLRVGLPLKCGEAVEEKVLRELFGDGVFSESFVRNRVRAHTVQYGDITRRFAFPYAELDRTGFESWLAAPVANHLRMNTRIHSVRKHGKGFLLQSSETVISTEAIILCCGASYALQRQLGLLRKEPRLGYAWGGIFEGDFGHGDSEFLWEPLHEAKGYAWSFPKTGGVFNIGVAGFRPKRLRSEMSRWLDKEGGAEKPKPRINLGGHFPADGVIARTHARGVLVAGDAAGMVFAGTGEGIAYALLSGRISGEVMAEAAGAGDFSRRRLASYPRLWQARFGKKLRAGVHFKRLLLFLMETGQLSRVMKRIPESVLQSMIHEGKVPAWALLRFSFQRIAKAVWG